jgi:RecJ-like exonuclease
MTESEKILREGIDAIADQDMFEEYELRQVAREARAKADALTKGKCPHCGGTGVDTDQIDQCPTCKGARFVDKSDAVKTDYLRIVEQAFIDCGAPHDYPLIMEIAKRLTKAQGGPKIC